MTQPSRPFLSRGRIIRSHVAPRYSVRRLALVLTTLMVLVVTNPANQGYWSAASNDFSLWNTLYKRSISNYGFHSLEKRIDGVDVLALTQCFPLCRFDPSSDFIFVCDFITDHLCHGKSFLDANDRPFTAHRLLCGILICSWILAVSKTTSNKNTIKGFALGDNVFLNAFASVIPSRIHPLDFIYLNLYLYPTLVSLDKFMSSPSLHGINPASNFSICFMVFVFGIGALSNWFAAILVREHSTTIRGLNSIMGACLGFQQAIQTREVFRLLGKSQSPATVFWTHVAISVFLSTPGTVVSWIAGGTLGYGFGIYLLDQISLWDSLWV